MSTVCTTLFCANCVYCARCVYCAHLTKLQTQKTPHPPQRLANVLASQVNAEVVSNMLPPHIVIPSADNMSPTLREAWIRHNAPGMDVLIVNPILVKTGLDLIMFSNLVFYETTTSLFVLSQSMLRVWRFGQDKEVYARKMIKTARFITSLFCVLASWE